MQSIKTTLGTIPLELVTLSKSVTRNSEHRLELRLVKSESGRVSTTTLTLPSANVKLYTADGSLENSPMKSSKSWLI